MNIVDVLSQQLNQLWGTRLQRMGLDAHRANFRLELFWTDQGSEQFASLVLIGVRYSRLEFDEFEEHEVVELVSVEAEDCVLGVRLFQAHAFGAALLKMLGYLLRGAQHDTVAT